MTTPDLGEMARFVQAPDSDRGFVAECLDEAAALVDARIGSATVPVVVRRRAVREVAADLYYRRSARNGVVAFNNHEGGDIIRVNRDPMAPATPLLAPYLAPRIA